MRLIDADVTKRRVADTYFDTLIPCVNHALDDSPTVDAVPVVRCRECDHGMPCVDGYVRCSHPSGKSILMKSSDFCSYGERKEGADNVCV